MCSPIRYGVVTEFTLSSLWPRCVTLVAGGWTHETHSAAMQPAGAGTHSRGYYYVVFIKS